MELDFSLINNLPVSVPIELDGVAPVSPCSTNFRFEHETFRGIKACIAPGDTVLDVGASYGVMTTLMAILAGPDGKVISIEPNPQAQRLAQRLVDANSGIAAVEFINALIGERVGVSDFYFVPGFQSVSSTRNAEILNFHSDSTRQILPMIRLDDLKLDTVSTIKIDVEGSEYAVLMGAKNLLAAQRPRLVIETHGPEIRGIAGDLKRTCSLLSDMGYSLWDLSAGRTTTAAEYSAAYGLRIGHLLAALSLDGLDLVPTSGGA